MAQSVVIDPVVSTSRRLQSDMFSYGRESHEIIIFSKSNLKCVSAPQSVAGYDVVLPCSLATGIGRRYMKLQQEMDKRLSISLGGK